jgi:hypothetical protein
LKTFLTQTTPVVPLTPDPPIMCFWKWIGWKDYEVPKNRNLESVSAKKLIFLSPSAILPAVCTRWAHPRLASQRKKIPSPSPARKPPPHDADPSHPHTSSPAAAQAPQHLRSPPRLQTGHNKRRRENLELDLHVSSAQHPIHGQRQARRQR